MWDGSSYIPTDDGHICEHVVWTVQKGITILTSLVKSRHLEEINQEQIDLNSLRASSTKELKFFDGVFAMTL